MNDGHQTLSVADAVGMFAEVATDASGAIASWRLVINTGGALNGGIATINKLQSMTDQGTLACCDPTVPGNIGFRSSGPGTWSASTAVCTIQLSKATFVNGDAVVAQVFSFTNTGSTPVPVEIKVWLDVPNVAPISVLRTGADGSVSLAANSNINLGPATLFTVTAPLPRGTYAFSCRLLNPVTGRLQSESLQSFVVQ
jgi:hypothetical protein